VVPIFNRIIKLVAYMGWLAVFGACGLEDRMIFFPSTRLERTPADAGLQYEDIFFVTQDGVRLHGWFIPHSAAKTTLVWFHGNAGNIGHRVENIKLLHDLVKVNIFIFDYRGYGLSGGRPSEAGTYRDGVAALEQLAEKIGSRRPPSVLFGRSLGAAVAVEMATLFPTDGLILESPFLSIREMARVIFPRLPIGSLLTTRYNVHEKIKSIKVPLLVLHGDRDDIVPFEHGQMIFEAAPEPKRFFKIAGAAHNDTYAVGGRGYFQQLKEFIDWVSTQRVLDGVPR
jgi:fermentation-respiration switch protein FrsA (DUF1100 family)